MANERMYPLLPCRDLDEAIEFYEALGFVRTFRQLRPNPCAVVVRDDLQVHLFGMPEFVPENSYGSVIIVVPDPDALYHSFAEGLRARFGKLPVAGIPRILRPRKKFGTVSGFTVVDVGGNWLRVFKEGEKEPDEETPATAVGLAKIVDVAARLGDSKGDEVQALKTLQNGLKRHADAPKIDVAKALLYQAELAIRLGKRPLTESSLAAIKALALDARSRKTIAEELERVTELAAEAS